MNWRSRECSGHDMMVVEGIKDDDTLHKKIMRTKISERAIFRLSSGRVRNVLKRDIQGVIV